MTGDMDEKERLRRSIDADQKSVVDDGDPLELGCVGPVLQNVMEIRETALALARKEALSHHNKDHATRLWATGHGGVYVPVTDRTPPNPYLSHLPDRDLVTPDGAILTLMNPAYMLREMMDHLCRPLRYPRSYHEPQIFQKRNRA
jgi:hypothetical protein